LTAAESRQLPLSGLRILDFSAVLAGPYASMLLADLGADVVKVEGTQQSTMDNTRFVQPHVGGESHYFLSLNRNKRDLSIDIRSPEAASVLRPLIRDADVVLHNFRPGLAEDLGLGPEQVRAINPHLIYCGISGFGATGSASRRLAYDLVIQAVTGSMDLTGETDQPPAKMGVPIADIGAGIYAAISILAHVQDWRDKREFVHVDDSMFDVSVSMLSYMAAIYLNTGLTPAKLGTGHATIYPYNSFETSDGYIAVAPFTQAFWRAFCTAIDRPELADDPRYASFGDRLRNQTELARVLERELRKRSLAVWVERFDQLSVPNGPINTVAQAIDDPVTRERGMVVEFDHPTAGRLRTIGTPFKLAFSDGTAFNPAYSPPPLIGEHNNALTDSGWPDLSAATATTGDGHCGIGADDKPGDDGGRMQPTTTQPLRGMKIVDFTRMFAGPFCTLLLADLGAEVIKVEEPRIGDPTRTNVPMVDGLSTYFACMNRGKRSVCLNLKTDEGRRQALQLVADADVVIENFRPGVMAGLGLDYGVVRAVNPTVVMCSISGFGATGRWRNKTSFDLVNQAIAGYIDLTGEPGEPPVRMGLPVGDLGGGTFGAIAILAALFNRRRRGVGAWIDLSLHDILLSQLGYLGGLYLMCGVTPSRVGTNHHSISPYGAYRTADGYLAIAAFTDQFWLKLVELLELPELLDDPRYVTMPLRQKNRESLRDVLENCLKTKTAQEWAQVFEGSGVPAGAVASVAQVLDSPLIKERDLIVHSVTPASGKSLRLVASPFLFNGVRPVSALPAPGHCSSDKPHVNSGNTDVPR
jgi:crotonobetainyl-CoA:carnitine CoA-transferase CaiB-like acyl-CoA transferase